MTLNQVPREIRQKIFEWVIYTPVIPPVSPSSSQEGRQRLSKNAFTGSGVWQLPPQRPAIPLLLVNKQFYSEVQHVLQRAPTNYHVDIMFVKDSGLWTTWSLPVLPRAQYIDSVHATVRLFDPTDDLSASFQHSLSFQTGCGGPETGIWSFYSLITTLLTNGPGYLGFTGRDLTYSCKARYAIKSIVVDFVAPTDGAPHRSVVTREKEFGVKTRELPDKFLHDSSIPPERRLAQYVAKNLDRVRGLDYYTMNYGTVLYEGIAEDIVFLVNGKEYRRIDMEESYQELEIKFWGTTPEDILLRKKRYQEWRCWLDERRRRMKEGLVLNDENPVPYII
ncbi:hypothetical protein AK830_g280 [Neonectria ditissima]|uniref:Uncharacterized protein n=1 Tax=Neonectria ditissima TaxID=78410 RepID=A0A0P7BXJ2_9HYPO|nr:hypothetical protein AK830_g280 [Neonectria ditissima]